MSAPPELELGQGDSEVDNSQDESTIERFLRVPINIYPENAPPTLEDSTVEEGNVSDAETERDDTAAELLPMEEEQESKQEEAVHSVIKDLYNEIEESLEDKSHDRQGRCKCLCKCSCMMRGERIKMTDNMRRARKSGLKLLKKLLFPLIPDGLRYTWVIFDLIVLIIGTVISGVTFSLENNKIFNITYLSISLLSTILALLDIAYVLYPCLHSKVCHKKKKRQNKRDGKKSWLPKMRNVSDVVRTVLSEMLIYPVLVCSIFSLAVDKAYKWESHIEGFVFILHAFYCVSLFFYFAIRVIALYGIAKGLKEVCSPSTKMLERCDANRCRYDPSISSSAKWYLSYFSIHFILQTVVQVLIVVGIGAKIWFENASNFLLFDEDNSHPTGSNVSLDTDLAHPDEYRMPDPTIYASGHLLAMIATGYFIPFFGFASFFIITYFWSQEFPIGLLIDMVSMWKMGSKDDVIYVKSNLEVQKQVVQNTLDQFFKMEKLVDEFKELHNTPFYKKITYPFRHPLLVFLCISYSLMFATFLACAALVYTDVGALSVHILNGGGWVKFYIATCAIGAFANLYVLLMAIAGILFVMFYIIAALCCCYHFFQTCTIPKKPLSPTSYQHPYCYPPQCHS